MPHFSAPAAVVPANGSRAASRRLLWISVLVGSVVTGVVCYEIATQQLLVGSREGGWIYGYFQPVRMQMIGVGLLAGALSLTLLGTASVPLAHRPWVQILLWMIVALGIQALLRSLTPFSFERIFASDGANAFYGVSRRYSAWTAIADFSRARVDWPLHAQSNMPGKLMLVYALSNISTRPGVLAWLVVIVSNLGGILMYLFVREVFDDRRMALFALVLYFFVPAKLFFFPLLNTITPVVVLSCLCLLTWWLRTGKAAYAALLGAALYVLVFFEPLPLVMGVLFAALVVRSAWRRDLTWGRLFAQGSLVPLAFVVSYAAVYAALGFDLIAAFRQISAHATEFNAQAGRLYSTWVRANILEFLYGAGACQSVLVVAALVDGFRRGERSDSMRQAAAVVSLALVAILVAVDLIGVNRGEVTRLWIFLACFFQIPAAYVCARLDSRLALGLVVIVTLIQDALGTAMLKFIVPD